MDTNKELLIITSSNGENLKLAKRFVEIAKSRSIASDLLDLTCLDLPLFNPRQRKENELPELVKSLNEKLHSIPKWVICSPEYNGSIPPVLTNAIAWLSVQDTDFRNLFNGRPIALASFSGGSSMQVLLSMRIQLSHLGAQVVGRQLASNRNKPAQDDSIEDLISRLMQMKVLELPAT